MVDLFTFVDLNEFEDFLVETETEFDINEETPIYIPLIIGAALLITLLFLYKKKKPKDIAAMTKEEFLEYEKAKELIKFLKEFEE